MEFEDNKKLIIIELTNKLNSLNKFKKIKLTQTDFIDIENKTLNLDFMDDLLNNFNKKYQDILDTEIKKVQFNLKLLIK